MKPTCAGCRQQIPHRRYLTCSNCADQYDIDCVNISDKRFYNTMTLEQKSIWKCPLCKSKLPKQDNNDTPIKPQEQTASTEEANVTLRRKKMFNENNESLLSEQLSNSGLGDTLNEIPQTANEISSPNNKHTITLDKFAELLDAKLEKILDTKLEKIKSTIMLDVRETIQKEVDTAIQKVKKSLEKNTGMGNTNNNLISAQIKTIDGKIEKIENQLKNLENSRKIVLYGLAENYNETEHDLYDRVPRAFHDIMNINLNPYIEEIKRIGTKGNRRAIMIQLTNKRMAKYITENLRYFKGTGLSAGEFLEGHKLQERNRLRKLLQQARRNGDHAIIKNDELIINGKTIQIPNQSFDRNSLHGENSIEKKEKEVEKITQSQPDNKTPKRQMEETKKSTQNKTFR